MRAWVVNEPGPIDDHPLELVELPIPTPGPGEISVRVLDLRRVPHRSASRRRRPAAAPRAGSSRVTRSSGVVDAVGPGADRFATGDRVGVPWLAHTCGVCRFCTTGRENLCVAPRFTGWDVNGGYAEYLVADQDYAYPLPDRVRRRARRAAAVRGHHRLPRAAAVAMPAGRPPRHLRFRRLRTPRRAGRDGRRRPRPRADSVDGRAAARAASSARRASGGATDPPPEPLDAAVLFAPVGTLVLPILEALDRGGTLAIAGIYLSDIPRSTTSAICSRSGRSAASRPTHAPTGDASYRRRPTSTSRSRRRRTRSSRRTKPFGISRTTASTARPCSRCRCDAERGRYPL